MRQKRGKTDNSGLILLALLLLFLAVIDISSLYIWKTSSSTSQQSSTISSARVSEVIDGKTLRLDDGQYVRLLGIDSPQQGSAYYDEAVNALKLLVLNKQIKLEKDTSDTDSNGRLIRYVYVDFNNQQLFVNQELVRQGYALSFFLEPNIKYRAVIEQARQDCLKDKIRLCSS